MKDEIEINPLYFTYEKWAIENREKYLELIQKAKTEAEKTELYEDLVFLNIFEIRRVVDIGLKFYVNQQIIKNEKIFFKAKKRITSILAESIEDPQTISELREKGPVELNTFNPMEQYFTSANELNLKRNQNKLSTVAFLDHELEKAIENSNFNRIEAIRSNQVDFITHEFGAFKLFTCEDVIDDYFSSQYYRGLAKKISLQNLKWTSLYQNVNVNIGAALIDLGSDEIYQFILKQVEMFLERKDETILLYNKLINDLLSIFHFEWFLSFPKEEKVSLLNDSFSNEDILQYYIQNYVPLKNQADFLSISTFVKFYEDLGLFNISYKMLINTLKKTSNLSPEQKFYLYKSLGYILLSKGKYTDALNYYKKSVKLKPKKSSLYSPYQRIVSYCRIVDILLKLNRDKEALDISSRIKKKIRKLTKKDQINSYFNLSRSFGSNQVYDKEIEYLNLISKESLSLKLQSTISRRLYIIQRALKKGQQRLIEEDKIEVMSDFLKQAHRLTNMFSFNSSKQKLKKAFKIAKELQNHEALEMIYYNYGFICFSQRNITKALDYFKKSLKYDIKFSPNAKGFIAAIRFSKYSDSNEVSDLLLDISKPNEKEYFYHYFVNGLLELLSEDEIKRIIPEIERKIMNKEDVFLISQILCENGFFEESIKILELIENKIEQKEIVWEYLGDLYLISNISQKGIRYYTKYLDSRPEEIRIKIKLSEALKMNESFSKSLEILENLENEISNEGLENKLHLNKVITEKELIQSLISSRLFYSNIPIEDISKSFSSAERLFFDNLRGERTINDFAGILVGYSKGIEQILHRNLTTAFIDESGYRATDVKVKKSKTRLRICYKDISQVFTTGQWVYLLTQYSESTTDVLWKEFIQFLNKKLLQDQLKTILEFCQGINKLRDTGVHEKSIDFETIINFRENNMQKLNKIVNFFYS